jgi:beta-lactamase class A
MKHTFAFLNLCLAIFVSIPLLGQPKAVVNSKTDKKLTAKLAKAIEGFHGNAGVYVRHLGSNRIASVDADSIFPTASMVKVPIMCGIFDSIEKGQLQFGQELVYRDSLKYDNGVVGSFKDSTRIPLPEVIHLMISLSDNTGSLWLQALAGGGAAINQWLEGNGYTHTRVNSRTPGRKQAQGIYGWGQTTPREMAELIAMIRNGKAINPATSERMFRYLGMQFWDGGALSQIPPYIKTADKTGSVNQAKSEAIWVNAPHGDYVLCVATRNQQDQRWVRDNEGSELIRKISAIVWEHFEPKSKWKPQAESKNWWF